ncbi:hypothetical protein BFINE_38180 [Bacteroides finegoldii DSM 17565]|nr:hypothetical protein BFINE_38180 [Bacteroides finegoldii DSM 17565]
MMTLSTMCWGGSTVSLQMEAYFKEHPDELADAEEAKAVLMAPTDVACDFTMAESKELKDRIVSSIKDFRVFYN